MADTVGIRPAVSGDLDLLWDVLAIAAHDPDAAAAPAVPMAAAHVAGWQRPGDFGLMAEPSGVAVRVVQVEAPGEPLRAGLAAIAAVAALLLVGQKRDGH